MNFLSKLFGKKKTPLSGEITSLDLARFLSYDGQKLDEQWFCDTCINGGIALPNARFAWEVSREAHASGDRSFADGMLFLLRLVNANAATRTRLLELMKGTSK